MILAAGPGRRDAGRVREGDEIRRVVVVGRCAPGCAATETQRHARGCSRASERGRAVPVTSALTGGVPPEVPSVSRWTRLQP